MSRARPPLLRYGSAVLTALLALLLNELLQPVIGPNVFPLFLAAVMISAWYGGLGPGLLAAGLAAAFTATLLLPLAGWRGITSMDALIRLGVFLLVALLIGSLTSALRRAEEKLIQLYQGEQEARRAAEQMGDRITRLQSVTAALSEAVSPELVADAIIQQGRAALGGKAAGVMVRSGDGTTLQTLRAAGLPPDVLEEWGSFPVDAPIPLADAVRTGEPVVLQSLEERIARYPHLAHLTATVGTSALVALPLVARERVLGGLGLSFPEARRFSADERTFMFTLAGLCAQALERAYLYEAEQRLRAAAEAARDRAALLADAGTELTRTLDDEAVLAGVARLVVPRLADWCLIDLCEENGALRRVAVVSPDPAAASPARDLAHRVPVDENAPYGPAQVLRTGRSELYPAVDDSGSESIGQDVEVRPILGEIKFTSYLSVPLKAGGQTLGILTLVTAESGRRYGPADLALAEELALRIALAVENIRLYHQVQQGIRTRDEFLAAAAHDLKNPVAGAKVHTQYLQRWLMSATLPPEEREQLVEGLGQIDHAMTRMALLIDELLDLTRLQMGRPLELHRRPTDLVALVRSVAEQSQRTTHKHVIQVESALSTLEGQWDAPRIERVVGNLLANAIKYSPDGGPIQVTVTRTDGAGSGWAILEVRDHGLGIPAHDLPRVFERFYRGSNVVGRIAGTGIGLSGARQIVEQHGGSIAVESQEGMGTRFRVRLPVSE